MPLPRDKLTAFLPRAALAFAFFWFLLGGAGHFIAADFFTGIVPPWVPYPALAVAVSGVFELIGAGGLLVPALRRPAGIGLFLLTLAVTPANVHMWLHPELFPLMPEPMLSAVLGLRLVVQAFLLYCIWYGAIRRPTAALAAA